MRVVLLAFGRLKNPGFRDAADYFVRLAKPWVVIEEEELKPLVVPGKSPAIRRQIQAKENALLSARIAAHLSPRGALYLLDESGKPRSTEQWAALARGWEDQSVSEAVFCIGSSLGFAPELRARARACLSFGPQTFSHELARLVFFEQIYRAWSVVRGHPYHVEGK